MDSGKHTDRAGGRRGAHLALQIACLLAICAAGLGLRVYRLDSESLWYDEAVSFANIATPRLGQFVCLERADDAPMVPFYFVLEYWWGVFGRGSELACRGLSVGCGLLTILFVYAVGRRFFGPWAGLFAALCVALARRHIYYSQEIRMYALVLLLALASIYSFHRVLDERRAPWWLAHAVVNALLLYTHLFAAAIITLEAAYLLVAHRRAPRTVARWAFIHVPLAISIIMWIVSIDPSRLRFLTRWITPPVWRDIGIAVLEELAAIPMTRTPDTFRIDGPLPAAVAVCVLFALLLLRAAGAARAAWAGREPADGRVRAFALLGLWLVVPLTALAVASYVWRPCFVSRYAFHSSLAFYLLAGAGVAALRTVRWRVFCMLAIAVLYGYYALDVARPFRPDVRSAVAAMEAERTVYDKVLVMPGHAWLPVFVYSNLPKTHPIEVRDCASAIEAVLDATHQGRVCWVVAYEDNVCPDWEVALVDNALAFERRAFPGRKRVFLYRIEPGRRAAPPVPAPAPSAPGVRAAGRRVDVAQCAHTAPLPGDLGT